MLNLRVNGILISSYSVRNSMLQGRPEGAPEIVIIDPALGSFSIDNSFLIEIQDTSIPPSKTKNRPWETVSMAELVKLTLVGKNK